MGLSLVAGSRAYFSCSVWLLPVATSPVAEHGLRSTWASVTVTHGLGSCGSWALEHRLSSGGACA